MHHCSARLIQSVPIREWFEHETVWEGAVHIFDLEGHPTASRAYAWSSSIEGSDNRRFFAVLHQPPITSPVDAVRAAIVAEQGITLEVRRCIKSQSTGRALDSGFGGTGDGLRQRGGNAAAARSRSARVYWRGSGRMRLFRRDGRAPYPRRIASRLTSVEFFVTSSSSHAPGSRREWPKIINILTSGVSIAI